MDGPREVSSTVLTDADTPPSRPGPKFLIIMVLAIAGIAYLVFTAFVKIDDQPQWLTGARTLPLIQTSAEVVMALVPNHHTFEGQRAPDEHRGPPPKSIRDLIEKPDGAPMTLPRHADVPKPPKPHKPMPAPPVRWTARPQSRPRLSSRRPCPSTSPRWARSPPTTPSPSRAASMAS